MRDSALTLSFWTAVAYIRGLVQPAALFFGKCRAYLIAFDTGSAMGITENDLPAYIGAPAPEPFGAEVVGIVKDSFGLYIIQPVQPDFL